MSGYFQSIDLRGHVPVLASIEFLSAEMPIGLTGPLALIQYAVNGQPQRLGLRLDIDKGVFLDSSGPGQSGGPVNCPVPPVLFPVAAHHSRSIGWPGVWRPPLTRPARPACGCTAAGPPA